MGDTRRPSVGESFGPAVGPWPAAEEHPDAGPPHTPSRSRVG